MEGSRWACEGSQPAPGLCSHKWHMKLYSGEPGLGHSEPLVTPSFYASVSSPGAAARLGHGCASWPDGEPPSDGGRQCHRWLLCAPGLPLGLESSLTKSHVPCQGWIQRWAPLEHSLPSEGALALPFLEAHTHSRGDSYRWFCIGTSCHHLRGAGKWVSLCHGAWCCQWKGPGLSLADGTGTPSKPTARPSLVAPPEQTMCASACHIEVLGVGLVFSGAQSPCPSSWGTAAILEDVQASRPQR